MSMPHLRLAPTPTTDVAAAASDAETIRVVLADDHALMRRALRLLLESQDGVEVIAEAGNLASLAGHVDRHRPHVLLLDLGMLDGSSSDLIRQLRERAPETRIVIVTMEENPVFAQRALSAGASGFVLKDLADEDLVEAVRLAARGEQYLSPRLALSLEGMHRAINGNRLTVREVEILRLITLGHTSVEIARKLRLSPRTVETHRARIHRKLGLTTRAELVAYALRRGLLRT
jgi:two-component system response regulator NreC